MASNDEIKIYGAIRCKTEEGKAAFAQQVFDETQGRFQSAINQDVCGIIAKGYKFGGFVTPSSSPISGVENYFYIATQNGTYVNFGGVTLNNETAILYNTDSPQLTPAICGQAICGQTICGVI